MKLYLPKKLLQSTSPSLQVRAMRTVKRGCNELTCQPVKLRLHEQFFTRDRNAIFRNYVALPSRGKIATRLHCAMARFADR